MSNFTPPFDQGNDKKPSEWMFELRSFFTPSVYNTKPKLRQ